MSRGMTIVNMAEKIQNQLIFAAIVAIFIPAE